MPKKKTTKRKEKNLDNSFLKFVALDGKTYKITLRMRNFCVAYLEWYGNGVEAVIEAKYDINYKKNGKDTGVPNRKSAAVIASQNLTKLNICAYITLKLEEYGFNDDNVMKQHLFLINQFADLSSKKGAIDMFYKVKGEYAAQKIKIEDDLDDIPDDEIEAEITRRHLDRGSGKKPTLKKKRQSS